MGNLAGLLMPDADDELAGGAVVLHVIVRLGHLLQAVVDTVHRERQPTVLVSTGMTWDGGTDVYSA
jgi:hypothetical protein